MADRGRVRRRAGARLIVAGLLVVGVLAETGPAGAEDLSATSLSLIGRGADAVGVYDPVTSNWYLRDVSGKTTMVHFGSPGGTPLVGDWDGDGIDGLALYFADGRLLTRETALDPISYTSTLPSGGTAVAGDFDGDGAEEVAVVRAGRLLLPLDTVGDQLPRRIEGDGAVIAGDWDGDGVDEVAVVADGTLSGAAGAVSLDVGRDHPVAGDWDGDGRETVGAFDSLRAEFTIYHGTRDGAWPAFVGYGSAGMEPVAGFFGDLPGGDAAPERKIGLPAMDIGSEGYDVVVLQRSLADLNLYRGPIDGIYDSEVSYGVVTLKKLMEVERTFSFGPTDWQLLSRFELPDLPDRLDEPDRVEVDIGRQVLYVILGGEVATIVPISSGGSYTYFSPNQQTLVRAGTPRGDFNLFHFATGWHCDPVTTWCIYNPWSFTPYYAIHGYGSVPAYPASHGCVRVTVTDADSLVNYLHVGIPLHIWDVHREEAA